jgi:glycosyltransferase involved in cell wall biosynthesis
MPEASVIVPARNAQATLPRTLAALSAQQFDGDYEVIVVDDGSRDATVAVARAAPGPVTVLTQGAVGPAAARNAGVQHSGGSLLAFCDADVFPSPGWLAGGVAALATADIVQGQVLPDPDAPLGPFDRSLWIASLVGLWETANLFVRRDVFDRVDGFEAWLSPSSGKALAEDVWFGVRAVRLGARPAYCADALAHHAVFARGWRAYVRERGRLEYFPAMAAQMPELRRSFLHRRLFLNWRTARLDAGVAGLAVALASGSPVAAVAMLPYLRTLHATARERAAWQGAPGVGGLAAADVCADLVGLVSLVAGTVKYRSPVL